METTIKLRISELPNFTKAMNALFRKDETVEITVSETRSRNASKKGIEIKKRMLIRKALDDADKRRNLITFKPDEFDEFSKALAAKLKR